MNKIIITLAVLTVFMIVPSASAQTVQGCKEDLVRAIRTTMGVDSDTGGSGYFKQLSDTMSTNKPTYTLIDEVQALARDAQIELKGICRESERFSTMDDFYVAAYSLNQCKLIDPTTGDTGAQLSVSAFCNETSDNSLDNFLESLRIYMLRQAIRTSVEPFVQRMRSLNARLTGLLGEYGRVVGNFYTFDFRLGDTVLRERD